MAVNEDYLLFVEDQLSEFGEFQRKKMFGGIGFFRDGVMFGMIALDTFRLKVDNSNRQDFEDRNMTPFFSGSKKKAMPYWEVPSEVLEDKSELAEWTLKAYEIALRTSKKK